MEEETDPTDARGRDPGIPKEKEKLGHHLHLLDGGHGGILSSAKDKEINFF